MIELSIVLPMFRSKYIAWLGLESLCRQQGIDFEWELIVAEEKEPEMLGLGGLKEYSDRLEKVKCAKYIYIPVMNWLPLAQKIVTMIDRCSSQSNAWIYHAADTYMPPGLLRTVHRAFQEDIDWFESNRTIYYDIATGKTALRISEKGDGIGTGRRLDLARHLSRTNTRRHSVDSWIRESYEELALEKLGHPIRYKMDRSDNWMHGFNTQGLNNISKGRGDHITKFRRGYNRCPVDFKKTIPKDIINRLVQCRKYLKMHKWGLPFKDEQKS